MSVFIFILLALIIALLIVLNIGQKRKLLTQDIQHQQELLEKAKVSAELKIRDRAISAANLGIILIDSLQDHMPIVYVNPAFEAITGYSEEETIGRNPSFLQDAENDPEVLAALGLALQNRTACQATLHNRRKNGETYWCDLSLSPIIDDSGATTHFIAIQEDVSARVNIEHIVQNLSKGLASVTGQDFLSHLVESLSKALKMEYVFVGEVTDSKLKTMKVISLWGKGKHLTGFTYDLANTPCEDVLTNQPCAIAHDVQALYPQDELLVEMGVESYLGLPLLSSSGKNLGILVALDAKAKEASELTLSMMDVFATRTAAELERLHMERALATSRKRIQRLAHYDELTNLPNRRLFTERLEHAIVHAQTTHSLMALMFLDLDRFKHINDSLGHEVGDQFLQVLSEKLSGRVREMDTVARLGGDEFVVLLEQIDDASQAATIAGEILHILDTPISVSQHQLQVTASIGISLYPENGTDPTALLRNADAAMYRAKEKGRNNFQFYTKELTEQAYERVLLESQLRNALSDNQFVVYYQAQYDLNDHTLVGAEALVRWQHPQRGLINPGEFTGIAEDSGRIIAISESVLQQACRQMAQWHKNGHHLKWMSVNLSGPQLHQADLSDTLAQILEETGLDARCLDLEISETFVMEQLEVTRNTLNQLHQQGITLSIDDFGTGHSSLSYLKQLPFDRLKLDQSFVRDIGKDKDGESIAKAILTLGKNLNLDVIAEGIETKIQADFLRRNGCTYGQGYLYAHPLPAAEFEKHIADSSALKATDPP